MIWHRKSTLQNPSVMVLQAMPTTNWGKRGVGSQYLWWLLVTGPDAASP